ncbi:lipopolysaccharide/colanic/teichoic acid biosynthesis glycosyltransferase [Pseudarthrobacter siccitolerans]|uniref:Lipopolysaccharide/colanic/teichoic acid biosynthesis glycosyltransferase n=1 Tax=Pseudarthrobacter siccitolerans TaxID=861266 RepID=A0ABU0PK92_9MICC|nr:sugar transferase [Pseudarthrobacter siccitolerans]MDQ0673952.1 lipopolysaccharide/colanic/teichoic acid biosynthesis glycosyltransferase [Pseudarthrobacter siccitolerans]
MDHDARTYLAKRAVLEKAVAALLLVVLSPIFALIAILIAVLMGRPILFRQQRVGQYGRVFWILKFRTLVNDAEEIGGGCIPADLNLVPPLGEKLRRYSLDELPQLVNIVRGDMSFVGPRPALPEQYARYTAEQAQRVLVPQGLTGLAQLAYRAEAPWSLRIEKDLEYVSNAGPLLDLGILIATAFKVLRADGVVETLSPAEVDDFGPKRDAG